MLEEALRNEKHPPLETIQAVRNALSADLSGARLWALVPTLCDRLFDSWLDQKKPGTLHSTLHIQNTLHHPKDEPVVKLLATQAPSLLHVLMTETQQRPDVVLEWSLLPETFQKACQAWMGQSKFHLTENDRQLLGVVLQRSPQGPSVSTKGLTGSPRNLISPRKNSFSSPAASAVSTPQPYSFNLLEYFLVRWIQYPTHHPYSSTYMTIWGHYLRKLQDQPLFWRLVVALWFEAYVRTSPPPTTASNVWEATRATYQPWPRPVLKAVLQLPLNSPIVKVPLYNWIRAHFRYAPVRELDLQLWYKMIEPWKLKKQAHYSVAYEAYVKEHYHFYTVPLCLLLRRARELAHPHKWLHRLFQTYTPQLVACLNAIEDCPGEWDGSAPAQLVRVKDCRADLQAVLEELYLQREHWWEAATPLEPLLEKSRLLVGKDLVIDVKVRKTAKKAKETGPQRNRDGTLTEQGREELRTGLKGCGADDVRYGGDTMRMRPQSHEITALVLVLVWLSETLNARLGFTEKSLVRINLRFLADYRNLFVLWIGYQLLRFVW